MRASLQPLRILIIDSHAVVRRGLRLLLDMQPDIQVVGEAGSVADARQQLLDLAPDLILVDPSLPDGDGIELSRRAHAAQPPAKIILLTGASHAQAVFNALDAQVDGYVLKDVAPAELSAAIRQVATGTPYFHPTVADLARRRPEHAGDGHAPQLTPRELDVLALMATTATNREIAQRLMLAEETVRSHVKSILRKLNARNRTQAVVEALRLELIQLQD